MMLYSTELLVQPGVQLSSLTGLSAHRVWFCILLGIIITGNTTHYLNTVQGGACITTLANSSQQQMHECTWQTGIVQMNLSVWNIARNNGHMIQRYFPLMVSVCILTSLISMEQGLYSSSYHKQQLHVADLPQLQQELVSIVVFSF